MTPKHSILTGPKNAKASSQATYATAVTTSNKASNIRESLEFITADSEVLEGEAAATNSNHHDKENEDDVKRKRMQVWPLKDRFYFDMGYVVASQYIRSSNVV